MSAATAALITEKIRHACGAQVGDASLRMPVLPEWRNPPPVRKIQLAKRGRDHYRYAMLGIWQRKPLTMDPMRPKAILGL